MNIAILYEDQEVLAIDKPAGVTVNRSETTHDTETMQDYTEKYLQLTPQSVDASFDTQGSLDTSDVFYKRSGIVHRLDKETSGILLVAKTPFAFFNLLKQFRERTVHKSYTALVHGRIQPQSGEIRVPVGRLSWNRKRFGVIAGGREAVTRYETMGMYQDATQHTYSLLTLFPETGRTHQIRVHLKYTQHPIVSDLLYGGRKTARSDRKKLPRLFLHASQISIHQPTTRSEITIKSDLPIDLTTFLKTLLVVEVSREMQ